MTTSSYAHLSDLLRLGLWLLLAGLCAWGSLWCAGYGLTQVWVRSCRPRLADRRLQRRVRDEARRGLVEIQAYLAARPAPPRNGPETQ
jgi:hypothetical protein